MQLKNRQQLLGIVAIAAVALFAADKILITPLTAAWKDRQDQIAELSKKVTEGANLVDHAKSLHSRWDQMRTNALPADSSAAEQKLLEAINRWAQEQSRSFSLNSLSPQMKKEDDNYSTLQCRVDASGRIEDITKFLYDIGRDPIADGLALRLDSIEVTAKDSEGSSLTLAMQVSGLVLTPQEKK